MKKLVLLVLLSVMSVGVMAENAHAIFGGMAWRGNYRSSGFGIFSGRRGNVIKAVPAIKKQSKALNSTELKSKVVEKTIRTLDMPVAILSPGFFDYENVVKELKVDHKGWLHGYQTRGGQ